MDPLCSFNALTIIKEIFWGKIKLDVCADYYGIVIVYILEMTKDTEIVDLVEEIAIIIKDSKQVINENLFVDEIFKQLHLPTT